MVFSDLLRTFNAAKCLVQIFYGKSSYIYFFSDRNLFLLRPFCSPAVHLVLDRLRLVAVH